MIVNVIVSRSIPTRKEILQISPAVWILETDYEIVKITFKAVP
jgi:hypothetical protein